MRAGMDVARINFSHGTHEEHGTVIECIRRLAEKMDKPLAILGDLQGPKIRVGKLSSDRMILKKRQVVDLFPASARGHGEGIPVDFNSLGNEVSQGETILLDEGMIRLKVLEADAKNVRCLVVEGGILQSRKGINLPGIPLTLPSLTEKDKHDLDFAIKQKLDYIAISFVRKAEDVKAVKKIIERRKLDIPVVAKLEKPQAIDNLDDILTASDGVMVARGDLGVEMSIAKVPVIQKEIIRRANAMRVPVITATQMLESMIEHSRPTRAEASDVANAIYDGTDAVMLSGETAIGKHPIATVQTMSQIIEITEKHLNEQDFRRRRLKGRQLPFEDAVSDATPYLADAINARVIVAFTQSGATARLISKCRTSIPVIAFTPHEDIRCRMSLYWGVIPLVMPFIGHVDDLVQQVVMDLKKKKLVRRGDNLVLLMGTPPAQKGTTNLIKLHSIQ